MQLNLSKIIPNPLQPRTEFDQTELENLAQSMNEISLIQPVVVEPHFDHGEQYILIDGERRWRAAQMLGWDCLDAHVRDGAYLLDHQKLEAAMAANVQHAHLNPIEEALAYQRLLAMGLHNNHIAQRCGVSFGRVSNRLNLLTLDEPIQQQVAAGNLPMSDCVVTAIRSIPNTEARIGLALKLAQHRAGVKTILASCSTLKDALEAEADKSQPAALRRVYKKFTLNKVQWDALAQIGKLPPWELYVAGIRKACADCSLGDIADNKVCNTCPVVMLTETLLQEAQP